ncbi:MAG: hypothetical protein HXY53_05190 [Nitrospirae bacterium]|nr:hypothetical protein [Nitrospirota bacterium]
MKRFTIISIMMLILLFQSKDRGIFADQSTESIKDKSSLSGKVIETMDSGRYTYVCLEKNNKKTWVAVYKMKVVLGEDISFKPGIEMVNFRSKTLNRTFDRIYFSEGPISNE